MKLRLKPEGFDATVNGREIETFIAGFDRTGIRPNPTA